VRDIPGISRVKPELSLVYSRGSALRGSKRTSGLRRSGGLSKGKDSIYPHREVPERQDW
jgi:hypothetical protein